MITAGFCTKEDAEKILFNPEIYDRISDDNCKKKEEIPYDQVIMVGGYINDTIVSLYTITTWDNLTHFMVLKPYRKHAGRLWEASLKIYPYPEYCEIPSKYMSLINFAKRYGFEEYAIEKNAYKKNNQLYNIHKLKYMRP